MWLGEFDAATIVDFKFTSRATTGAPTTLSGSPVISIYKANGTTESTAGVTLTADFDSRTGLNHVRVDTSADGTFYATGNDFQAVVTTGTVGGVSVVGEVVGHFSLRNRAGLYPTTAARTLDVASTGEAGLDFDNIKDASGAHTLTNIRVPNVTLTDTVTTYTGNTPQTGDCFARLGAPVGASISADVAGTLHPTVAGRTLDVAATGEAGLDFDNIKDASGAHTLTNIRVPNVTLTDTVTTYTGNTPQTGDAFARLGAPVGASISADIAGVQSDTDNIQTRIPAALVGGRIDSSVGAMAANVLTATAINADAFTAAKFAADVGVEFADTLLDRDMSTGSDSGSPTVRTVRQALRALRNRFGFVGTTRTVYKEDDATASWTSVVTTSAGAAPVIADDPAGP